MKRVCAGPNIVNGIDIYKGDSIRDVTLLKPNGIMYAMLKAYEYVEDTRFKDRWESMKEHGILRGAYDFFHPNKDAVAQAKAFCSIVGPLQKGDLPSWLDWETTGGTLTAADKVAGLSWLNEVEQIQGFTPGIYGSSSFLQDLWLDSRFSKYSLWIAEYGVKCPLIPAPWTTWQFWQTTEGKSVPGMSGPCDTDIFNGTMEQLQALCLK